MPDTSDHSEELRDALQRQSDRLRKHQTQSFNVVLTDDEIAWAEHRAEEADLTVRAWIQHVISVEIPYAPDALFALIGWIDQEGTIWPHKEAPNNNLPPFVGSLTPLLVPSDD